MDAVEAPLRRLWFAFVLSSMASCGGDEPPALLPTGPDVTTGSISVILASQGEGNDTDGVKVSLWAGSLIAEKPAMLGDTVSFGPLPAGTYTVSVAGLDPLCRGDLADVVEVRSQSNTLRLNNECAGRILYEKEFSASHVAVLYVNADSRLRTLALSGRWHVRDTSPDGERALVEEWQASGCGIRVHTAVATLAGGIVPLQQNPARPVTAGARWSPRGDFLAVREEGSTACGDSDGRAILLFDPATGAAVRTVAEGTGAALGPDVAWSPEGGRLAYVRDNVILVYDVNTGGLSQLHAAGLSDRPSALSWAPSGRYLLFRPAPGEAYRLLDLTNGSVSEIPLVSATAPVWHPTDHLIALVGEDPTGVFIFDLASRTVTPASDPVVPGATHPSWNAAGDRLLLSGRSPSGARALYVVDWPDGAVWHLLEGDAGGPARGRWTRGIAGR